jgi:hypothetical protein
MVLAQLLIVAVAVAAVVAVAEQETKLETVQSV